MVSSIFEISTGAAQLLLVPHVPCVIDVPQK